MILDQEPPVSGVYMLEPGHRLVELECSSADDNKFVKQVSASLHPRDSPVHMEEAVAKENIHPE